MAVTVVVRESKGWEGLDEEVESVRRRQVVEEGKGRTASLPLAPHDFTSVLCALSPLGLLHRCPLHLRFESGCWEGRWEERVVAALLRA